MKTILDTLETARLAASPSAADDLRIALDSLHTLADALDRTGLDLSEAASALDDLHDLRAHVKVQPFETADGDDPPVTELTPGAFADWLATLERLTE